MDLVNGQQRDALREITVDIFRIPSALSCTARKSNPDAMRLAGMAE